MNENFAMNIKDSHLSLSKTQLDEQSARNQTRKSVTFSELAEEEAKEQSIQTKNLLPSSEFQFGQINYYRKDYDEIISQNCQNEDKKSNLNLENILKSSLSLYIEDLDKDYKISKNDFYCKENENANEMINFNKYNFSGKNLESNNSNKKLMLKAKKYVQKYSYSEEYKALNNNLCYEDSESQLFKSLCNCINNPRETCNTEHVKNKIMQLEIENSHYVSELYDMQSYIQILETNLSNQTKYDKDNIKKLENIIKLRKNIQFKEVSNINLSKEKEIQVLKSENMQLKKCIAKMNEQIANLNKMQSKLLKAHINERKLATQETSIKYNLNEENKKLKEIITHLEAEINNYHDYKAINYELIEEIENHVVNQNNLTEQNDKLQCYIHELETEIREKSSVISYQDKISNKDAEKLFDNYKKILGDQKNEIKLLKNENEILCNELNKIKLCEKNDKSHLLIKRKRQKSYDQRDLTNIAIRTEKLNHGDDYFNNICKTNIQEKTLKSTDVTINEKYNSCVELTQKGNKNNYSNLSEDEKSDHRHKAEDDTLRSSATFGKY